MASMRMYVIAYTVHWESSTGGGEVVIVAENVRKAIQEARKDLLDVFDAASIRITSVKRVNYG